MPSAAIVIALLVVGLFAVPVSAHAGMGPSERCQNVAASVVLTMKAFRDSGQARDVALDQAGLEPGSARGRLADQAYRQLEAGTAAELAIARARAECLRVGPDAFERDGPAQGAAPEAAAETARLPVCGDVASVVAAVILDEPDIRTASVDDALAAVRSSDPRDIATPELRRIVEIALQRARVGSDRRSLQQALFRECDTLEPARRAALEREAYVP